LYPPEFFVLHFEFDLMHPQFMNKGGGLFQTRITRSVGLGFQAFLGSLSEIFGTFRAFVAFHYQDLRIRKVCLIDLITSLIQRPGFFSFINSFFISKSYELPATRRLCK
jgi:hypothetical protein